VASDLSFAQSGPGKVVPVMNIGMSQSSATGMAAYGATAIVFMDLSQVALSTRYTKMLMSKNGTLLAVNNYSVTYLTDYKNHFLFAAYSLIVPFKNGMLTGYNVSMNNTLLFDKTFMVGRSFTVFAMKPIPLNKKKTVTPEFFLMQSPMDGGDKVFNSLNCFVGASYDLSLSKKFKLSLNSKVGFSNLPGGQITKMLLIGSKISL
jgi:hypothetical protein